MHKNFKRQISSISKIFDFVSDILASYKVEESISFSINLAIEELFTNCVKYGHNPTGDFIIDIEKSGNTLIVNLIDLTSIEFDVSKTPNADVTSKLEDRKIGGLGLHLVKKMVDKLEYKYSDGKSIITLTKNLENTYV
jgi:serine/threonine-protein kinase RsbW